MVLGIRISLFHGMATHHNTSQHMAIRAVCPVCPVARTCGMRTFGASGVRHLQGSGEGGEASADLWGLEGRGEPWQHMATIAVNI